MTVCAYAFITLSQGAHALMVIDDFSTGEFAQSVGITGFNDPSTWFTDQQSGTMIGGTRTVTLETGGINGSTNSSTIGVGGGALELELGVETTHRLGINYGAIPLGLDLSGEDRLRLDFNSNTDGLNFNILLFDDTASYLQIGYNITPSATPFNWDFLFSDGVLGAQPGVTTFNFNNISSIYLQTQTGIAGQDFSISGISATHMDVPEPTTLLLFGLGFVGLLSVERWRQRQVIRQRRNQITV
jgi:hypothetical protein